MQLNEFSTAIVRIEQLYPLPVDEIIAQVKLHPNATLLWVQDEPANQGPWPFVALAVAEAFVAHRWYDKSQLGMLYAAGLPVAVRDAVTALDQGISYGERDRLDAATKKK